jgi:hypothetical protein
MALPPYNPLAGTSLSDSWYLKRKAPNGRVTHLIDPIGLGPLCDSPLRDDWVYVPEEDNLRTCSKCRAVESNLSKSQEIDNERLR